MECGVNVEILSSSVIQKNDKGCEIDRHGILKTINGKKYLDVEQMQKDHIYLFLVKKLRHLCRCEGWGCIFCCEDYDELRKKSGIGY